MITVEVPTIKDSGERRQFDTGAVRDITDNKGRCDLMPLGVVADLMDDIALTYLSEFQEEPITEHLQGAILSYCGDVYNGDVESMLLDVSKHFEAGAKKYGENNWQKGIPVNCYIDSAVRHYLKFKRGDKDEPHGSAFVWNLMCCAWEVEHHVKNQ